MYIKKLEFSGVNLAIKFLHGRVLWNFEMAFSIILDFLRGLKSRAKGPTSYNL